ncbi:DUF4407 domain-containing protein [Robiginitalea sp. M366]|uniref:DUF4407 domain-containing protein n=1 Tax=Robiginitalea aestuariiviva TaxID=3036903 RepID=UPI00240E2A0A|nr:DUF4407 domain-containing protein [Robiginitalea aestuariiviva]MDG1571092.1 DUF4407 domain-containing protein [Robiginitalea aestuariiviva]
MIRRFFILCSGADRDLLESCSSGEQNKYAGIGATVFFTALMAFLAAGYALFTVFDNLWAALGFGLVWGLLIFNLDRYIVSTMRKRDGFGRELLQAAPRIFLAVIIAVVISKPLELKIFEKEIDQVLLERKNQLTLDNQTQLAEQFNPAIAEKQAEITALKQEIADKQATTDALYDTYIAEAEGREGTLLLGKGPVYKEKREKHDASLAELQALRTENQTKIAGVEAEIADLEAGYTTAVTESQPVIDRFDGLMARIDALGTLPWFPSFFIFLLFLAVETAPILVKLMTPKGPYDMKLEDEETAVQSWVQQKVDQRFKLADTDRVLNEKIYAEIAEEEAVYAYKKQKAESLMRLQAARFHDLHARNL